ncbi:MAG TPA: glycoside hydrolase family 28 protein [Rhizomicrobium sp.]
MTTSRRAILGSALALGAAALPLRAAEPSPWDRVPEILARIRPPVFPRRDFRVTDYGAGSVSLTDDTPAFAAAIAACHASGGGRVVAPAGHYVTGPLHLKSNVNLHLEKGATILFSTATNAYLPLVFTRWEGVELMNYSPLIYALDCENVAITGKGTLDGGASATQWWPWKGKPAFGWRAGMPSQEAARNRLFAMAERGVPVAQRIFGDLCYLRPSFIQPYRCRNVLIEGVTIRNAPMWEVHPVLCSNVTVRGLTIDSAGPNTDGCDPESCRDVLIEDCFFNTGDDCIAIKSGRNADGRRVNVASQNIVIRNCRMKNGHGAVTIGSEISGGVHNVFAERCTMSSPALVHALRIKNNAMRGGVLEHLYFRDMAVGQVAHAVLSIDENYEEGPNGPFTPIVRDVRVERVVSAKSAFAIDAQGYANAPIRDVLLKDCDFKNVAGGSIVKNVRGLRFEHVTINGKPVRAPI